VSAEAIAEDITDDILCNMDDNFVVYFEQAHQDAERNGDYMFTLRPPTLKCVVKTGCLSQTPTPPFFTVVLRPNAGHGLLILEVSRSKTMTHHSR
jgi:hypothetical protein